MDIEQKYLMTGTWGNIFSIILSSIHVSKCGFAVLREVRKKYDKDIMH